MKDLRKDAERNLEELRRALDYIDKKLVGAPAGRLDIYRKNNRTFYMHVLPDSNKAFRKTYLSASDKRLIQQLAYKNYYQRVRPKIIKEINALEKFLKSYYPNNKNELYMELVDERQKLITPLFSNPTYEYKRWLSENHEEYTAHPETKKFMTSNGELVRSKSELMIANSLAMRSNDIVYRYEPQLVLNNGHAYRPDFGTLSLRTGKRSWLEHAGLMDKPEYAESFVRKINDYQDNGLVLGVNLFVTMETSTSPLMTANINRVIERMVY